MAELFRSYWVDTIRHTEKISSRQTFTDILNHHCDLDTEHSEPICMQTLWLTMLYNHARFGDKMFYGSEDIVQTKIHQHF